MNLIPILKKKYPEKSIGGECAAWAECLASFGPVGDSLKQKQRFVQLNGIVAANISEIGKGFRIGDIVVTNQTDHGHVFMVADMDGAYLYAAESNFNLDQKIHYGRKVSRLDPVIYGIIRAPLLIDLGDLTINYAVFINHQPKWNLGVFDEIAKTINSYAPKIKVNFFALQSDFQNWSYENFVFDGVFYSVIKKSFLDQTMMSAAVGQDNKSVDVRALLVNPNQWQGSISNGQTEFAFTASGKPGQIQGQCAEFDLSPWYFGMRLVNHLMIHELAHYLYWINGLNDDTHKFDNPITKGLEQVYSNLDINRVIANL